MPILTRLTCFALLGVSACTTDPNLDDPQIQEDHRSGGKADGQSCDLAGLSAQTYLNAFRYAQDSTDSHGGNWYRIGDTFDTMAAVQDGDRVTMSTYLLPEGRAIINYAELHRITQGDLAGELENLQETVIVTEYSADADTRTLTLRGVASGSPITKTFDDGSCVPAYSLKYTDDIRSPGLDGDATVLSVAHTTGRVIDPDHLDQLPSEMRDWFEQDVASGKIVVQHR